MMQSEPTKSNDGKLFLRGLGIILLLFSAVYLVTGVILRPVMPPVVQTVLDGIYDGLLCAPDENYQQDPFLRGALRRNIVSEGDSWCENAGGEKRDISYSEFNLAVALFVLPMLVGSLLLGKSVLNSTHTSAKSTVFQSPAGGNLSSRLQELQSAYDKGLITDAEYNQTRANILKQMEK